MINCTFIIGNTQEHIHALYRMSPLVEFVLLECNQIKFKISCAYTGRVCTWASLKIDILNIGRVMQISKPQWVSQRRKIDQADLPVYIKQTKLTYRYTYNGCIVSHYNNRSAMFSYIMTRAIISGLAMGKRVQNVISRGIQTMGKNDLMMPNCCQTNMLSFILIVLILRRHSACRHIIILTSSHSVLTFIPLRFSMSIK